MELKILYLALFFIFWTVLIRYVPKKIMWWPSVIVVPVGAVAGIIYILVAKKSILMAVALVAGLYLYFRWVKKRKKDEVFVEIVDWVKTVDIAVLLALLIMTFIVQAFKIPSGSMRNTFIEGDHLFVGKFIYGVRIPFVKKTIVPLGKPKRGDIIVFEFPLDKSKDYIKRCIGLPGDVIEMKEKKLYINGKLLEETYVIHKDPSVYPDNSSIPDQYRKRDNFEKIKISTGCYFMMGDNRDRSYDSRFWGELEDKYVKGRALFIYWPLTRIGIAR